VVRVSQSRSRAGVYAAKKAAQAYGSVIMAHVHSPMRVHLDHIEDIEGISMGCLCNLNMEYTNHALGTLRWRHGWAWGVIDKAGRTTVHLSTKQDGHFNTEAA